MSDRSTGSVWKCPKARGGELGGGERGVVEEERMGLRRPN